MIALVRELSWLSMLTTPISGEKIKCDTDLVVLQNDFNRLSGWSVANQMNFYPEKCKVLPVTNKWLNHVLPFHDHIYELI